MNSDNPRARGAVAVKPLAEQAGILTRIGRVLAPGWFGAGQPMEPVAPPDSGGRAYDYQTGINISAANRRREGGITFDQMRAIADRYSLLRAVIETRKDQLARMDWTIRSKDKKTKSRVCKEIEQFLQYPDNDMDWDTWLRALLEDVLVVDAATIYPRRSVTGKLLGLELVDGTTIARLIDDNGRTPLPPEPAYQQILKGLPATNYTTDELLYRPRVRRTHKLYGFSPVEQIIDVIDVAIRRHLSQRAEYTEGNVPESFIGVPETWGVREIKEFQAMWDELLAAEGTLGARRKARFVPGAMKYQPTRQSVLKDEYDEWLARVICFAFSISNTPFIKQVNRSTSQTQMQQAEEEGLAPLMHWIKSTMDAVLTRFWPREDVEFAWEEEDALDPLTQMNTLVGYTNAGIVTVDEAREKLGYAALPEPEEVPPATVPPGVPPVPAKEGDTLPAPKEPGAQSSKEAEDEAIDKAVKVRAINRNRAAVRGTQGAIRKAARAWLAANRAAMLKLSFGDAEKLEKVSAAGRARKLVDSFVFKDVEAFVGNVQGILERMAKEGVSAAAAQLADKSVVEQANPRAVAYAKKRAAELVKGLEAATRDSVRGVIAASFEEGVADAEIASRLAGAYTFSEDRAMVIARTETAAADVAGNMAAYRASGLVIGKRSILGTNENHGDEDIENADAGVIGLDEQFPSGHDGPPYHPNCVCDVIPVLEGDDK